MERSSRKKFSSSFKSKVALEAVKGLKTINEIASEYGLQPVSYTHLQHHNVVGIVYFHNCLADYIAVLCRDARLVACRDGVSVFVLPAVASNFNQLQVPDVARYCCCLLYTSRCV